MNLDLIIKLAKLANNNPNENEANLAARKVCRLMAESDFIFREEPKEKTVIIDESRPWDRDTKDIFDYLNYMANKYKKKPETKYTYKQDINYDSFTGRDKKQTKIVNCKRCNKEVKVWIERDTRDGFICNNCYE